MDNYTVLAEVSECLLNMLKEHCSPDPIPNPDKIGLASPATMSDFALALILYEIKPMDRGLFDGSVFPLCLRYVLTAESQAVPEIRADEEARILGRAVWALANNPVIDAGLLNNNGVRASIIMENLSIDEKTKAFNPPGGMRPAVFYSVSPVLISVSGGAAAERVRSVR